MKLDLREVLPKVRNPPFFTLRKEKNKGGFMKLAPGHYIQIEGCSISAM